MDLTVYFFKSADDWYTICGLVYPAVAVFVLFWIFAFGACIGSFLNVCIWRIPRGESLSKAASHCTVCGEKIYWYDNIPVASYLILRGKCRSCRTPYSSSYFWVELTCGVLTAAVFLKTGLTGQSAEIIPARMLLIFFALACAVTDFRFQVVPDKLTYSGMILALLAALLLPGAFGEEVFWKGAVLSLISGGIPALLLAVFAVLGKLVCRKDVMGWGDIKFTVLTGMLIGLPGVLFSLLAGSFAGALWGLIVKRKFTASLPFVPFMSAGAVIWVFFDQQILSFYLNLFNN